MFDQALAGGGAKNINFNDLAADLAEITFTMPFRIPPYVSSIGNIIDKDVCPGECGVGCKSKRAASAAITFTLPVRIPLFPPPPNIPPHL